MEALDTLFKRLEVNTTSQQTKDAVVIHRSSAPIIMSINPTSKSINDFADRIDARFDRIDATFDRIDASLSSISKMLKALLEMMKENVGMMKENFGKSEELLQVYRVRGPAECSMPNNQARIGDIKVSYLKHHSISLTLVDRASRLISIRTTPINTATSRLSLLLRHLDSSTTQLMSLRFRFGVLSNHLYLFVIF